MPREKSYRPGLRRHGIKHMDTPTEIKQLKQKTNYTCGPASLRYVFHKHGVELTEEKISKEAGATAKHGIDPNELVRYAHEKGFKAESLSHPDGKKFLSMLNFLSNSGISVIVDYLAGNTLDDGHYVVFLGFSKGKVKIWNPSGGNEEMLSKDYFLSHWKDTNKANKLFKNLAVLIYK